MAFNPEKHLIKIGSKEYLPVAWRIVFFRDSHPNGQIETEYVSLGDMLIVKAIVCDENGRQLASGSATVRKAGQKEQTWANREIEKAETAAIGRALAHAGFGTQFTEDDEGDYLADSPIESNSVKQQQRQASEQGSPKVDPQDAWSKDNIQVFFNYWTNDRQYTKDAILAALKVKAGKEWKGTLTEAQAAMEKFAELNPPF